MEKPLNETLIPVLGDLTHVDNETLHKSVNLDIQLVLF